MRFSRRTMFAIVCAAFLIPQHARAEEYTRHAVVAQEGHAAEVGRDVLRRGGNAVDAAVATAFALAVTHPEAGNLGGGGFLVAYLADSGRVVTLDFRESAPLAATERMYLDAEGKLLPGHRAGPRAAGVPGTVRGLGVAHERFGILPWMDLVTPAAQLARDGFPISGTLAQSLNSQLRSKPNIRPKDDDSLTNSHRLADFAASVRAFSKPDGTLWQQGDRLIQLELAETLDRIAAEGPDEFYRGKTATLIADHCAKLGGLITRDDLSRYEARWREPARCSFRGHEIYSVGPPSSGGVVLSLILNILEPYDLKADGPYAPRTLHRVTEAMRRAFYVRALDLGDPDFVMIPLERILSKDLARELGASIDEARATPSASLAPFHVEPAEENETTHLSVIDSKGNAVALTFTLEEEYGCKSVVEGAGFLLNNEMGDFNLIPGRTDASGRIGTPANLIAPRKRMLSSQTPTIVLKDGQVRLVTGSPGGRTIPNTVAWVVLQLVEFGQQPDAAIGAARTHHSWFPDRLALEGTSWDRQTVESLRRIGHTVATGSTQGNANSIVIDLKTRRIHGVADARRGTSHAAGD